MAIENAVERTHLLRKTKENVPARNILTSQHNMDTLQPTIEELLLLLAQDTKKKIITEVPLINKEENKNILNSLAVDKEIFSEDDFNDVPIFYDNNDEELFHKQLYQQMLEKYVKFLSGYLKEGKYREFKPDLSGYNNGGNKIQETTTTEVSMLTFDERTDYNRAFVMNSLLGAGANHIDTNTKDSWELWRVFQHNQIMSFFYTSQWRH